MRSVRRWFPRVSWLLVIAFLLLIVSFATYMNFTENHPYRQFAYFRRATKESQMDIQQTTPETVTNHWETLRPPKVILRPGSSVLEHDAVKRLAPSNNNLYPQEKHAEVRDLSASTEEEIKDRTVIATANKKQAEMRLKPIANKIQAKGSVVTPTATQNLAETANKKKSEKNGKPISDPKEEENKAVMLDRKGKKEAAAKYVTPASSQKQPERDVTRAYHQKKLEGEPITRLSSVKQMERKIIGEMNTAKEHWMSPTPHALKLSTKVKSTSITVNQNVPASGAQHITHPVSAATQKKRLKASDFKSEPHWEFEDQYLLDSSVPPSNCPNSLRVKAARSDLLKDIFLPNITLFMDRSHFNDSEWERMEHFAPPFGFMELNYSLVKEVITMLPPKPHHQILLARNNSQTSKCISCAVVGNGGILNNSRMGQEIDSHDFVFRVSGAVIKGYERDVGTRTSFYGFTAYSLMASLAILGHRGFTKIPIENEIKYLHFLEGERDYEWLKALLLNKEVKKGFLDYYGRKPRDKFDNTFSLDRYFVIHPDFLRYMKNRFLKSKSLDKPHWRIYRPTTGAFLLLTALHLCDQVSAYGYITEGYQKYSDHYYDKEWKRLIFYVNHDFDLERRVWKQLHDANVMTLYQ